MEHTTIIRIIRDIGRGKNAAGDLSRDDSRALFTAMLNDEIPPLQLVAREGMPVLVHGVPDDPGRVTTLEIFATMGMPVARDIAEAQAQLASRSLAVIAIDTLAPPLARVLALRHDIGLRSSGHTLVKMLQPFTSPALRLVSVTHPEYLDRMRAFFSSHATGALLLRGAEGEAVAHPRREPAIAWLDGKKAQAWHAPAEESPELPGSRNAAVTAAWISDALAGKRPVPCAIAHQVDCCLRAGSLIRAAS